MIGEVLAVYSNIMLEFLFELYLYYFLTMRRLARTGSFWLRLALGFAAMALFAFAMSFVYYFIGLTAWGRILVYVLLFGASFLHVRLCLREPTKKILYGCSLAYAAQNLTYKGFLVFWCAGEQARLFNGWGERYWLYYRLVYYAFFACCVALLYVCYIRRITRHLGECRLDVRMLAISVFILLFTIVLCSFEDVYFAQLSIPGQENAYAEFAYYVLRQTGNLSAVACCIAILLLIFRTLEGRELRREVEQLQDAIRQSERQYELSRDAIDRINLKCHDIKYKIGAMLAGQGGVPPDTVEDLRDAVSIYDAKVETGNPLLDVLLTEKSLFCEQNGIRFSCMADGEKLGFLQDGDLYCLFGNLIDNALEAVSRIVDREKRVISVTVRARGSMLLIEEENYYEGDLAFEGGLPSTTKGDKAEHGFGMRNMRLIARKYGGELAVSASGGVFRLTILFPGV